MKSRVPPKRCFLCNAAGLISSAGFRQVYPQKDNLPALLDWWECSSCKGWFAYPVPPLELIQSSLATVAYNSKDHEYGIFQRKTQLFSRVLTALSRWVAPGNLLDFGSSYGRFLALARTFGWSPCGFEPFKPAAELARGKGFDVRTGWSLDEAAFPEAYFHAITAIDSFYYVWNPNAQLVTFHRLLVPGGVLAMRVSNKRTILGLVRAVTSPGAARDARLSSMLQRQFHSISVARLKCILNSVGFDSVRILLWGATAPWSCLRWKTRAAYLTADAVYLLTLTAINISPGVVILARKPFR